MRKNNNFRRVHSHTFGNVQNNSLAHRIGVKGIIAVALLAAVALLLIASACMCAHAEEDKGRQELNEQISELLKDLDLGELEEYLNDNPQSYLFKFGDSAREIIEYLISGNAEADYGGYLSEIAHVVFGEVIGLVPAFAAVTAIALLCAVVSSAEGSVLGKSTSKIVRLACYSLIILIITSVLAGVFSRCVSAVNGIRRQIEIITPILATLTVLTGGAGTARIYQPSAIFLSGGAVEIVSGFIFPATVTVTVLDFLSRFNPDMSFSGVTALIKSVMKWVIGITVTVFSIFITVQNSASSLFDGILFKATKYVVGNSVPMVGNFLSSGFDMLASAGLLIKSSVGVCGIILLLGEIASPVILLVAFSFILKIVGAVVQPVGENGLYGLLSDLSKNVEYFIAGLLTVAFMYALVVMLVINSANSFI